LEGLLLLGAFAAVAGSYYMQSALAGVITAMLAGALGAGLYALLVVRWRGDEIIVALALNLLIAGLTVFLPRSLFAVHGVLRDPRIAGLERIDLPLLSRLPVLGPLLSGHTALDYLALLLVILSHLLLFYHRWGLRVRAVGEQPAAAMAAGVNAGRVRCGVIVLSGMLCALGGAQLALGNVTLFVENMSAGRGWIAVVAVMLGQAYPLAVFSACVLFGAVDSLSFRLQGLGLVSQLTDALPYGITLISLIIIAGYRKYTSKRKVNH
jgi:simple sugar transport system permease protein